jgi:hypothetical protein
MTISSINKQVNLFLAILLPVIIFIAGCSSDKTETIPEYPGWIKYSYKHFVFHYPENCYWGKKMDTFSDAYERYLRDDCEFLAIEIPADTIHFYIHDNPEKGKELTGRELDFHTENQIHWGRQTPFGMELAKYLIDKMGLRRTDFDFLYDGMVYLRDYSGTNFHHLTASAIEIGKFIPLDSLANNESYARADDMFRFSEAASLVAFITYHWGINRFKMLWQTTASFEMSVKELFEMDLPTFEAEWKKFAMQYFEGLGENRKMPDSAKNK